MHSALVSWSWTLLCLSSESQMNLWTCVEALLALLWGSSSSGALSWYHIWQGNNVKPSPSSSTIAYFTSNIRNKLKMMIKWCESKHKLLPDPLDHNIGVSYLWPLAEIAKLLERSVEKLSASISSLNEPAPNSSGEREKMRYKGCLNSVAMSVKEFLSTSLPGCLQEFSTLFQSFASHKIWMEMIKCHPHVHTISFPNKTLGRHSLFLLLLRSLFLHWENLFICGTWYPKKITSCICV